MEVSARTTFDELMAALERHEMRRRNDDAAMLEALARLDDEWPDDPAVPDLVCEIAVRLGISAHTAAERLRIARALRDLPQVAMAHRLGGLSWDQLRWVSRFATSETDALWAERAPGMRPDALRLESLRQRRLSHEECERDRAGRRVSMDWDEDHRNLDLHATLPAGQGAKVEAALNAAAQQITVEDDVDDPKGARLAEALVGLVTSSGGRSSTLTLVIHADAEVLAGTNDGKRHLAETSSGMQLSHQAIRRIACDAKMLTALHRGGRPVGITSRGRTVTEHQMEMLLFRDRGCTYPGCGSTWFLHAHHIRHWADGGKTTLENLTLLCGTHHRRVHDGRWTIRGRPPDRLEFVSPSGRVLRRASPELARAL